jgi:hypothetical protein
MHLKKETIWFKTKADYVWHGKPLYFKPAPEPSNILWEN